MSNNNPTDRLNSLGLSFVWQSLEPTSAAIGEKFLVRLMLWSVRKLKLLKMYCHIWNQTLPNVPSRISTINRLIDRLYEGLQHKFIQNLVGKYEVKLRWSLATKTLLDKDVKSLHMYMCLGKRWTKLSHRR